MHCRDRGLKPAGALWPSVPVQSCWVRALAKGDVTDSLTSDRVHTDRSFSFLEKPLYLSGATDLWREKVECLSGTTVMGLAWEQLRRASPARDFAPFLI